MNIWSVLPRVDAMTQLNLFKYFRASSLSPQVALPSPNGPLSHEVPSTAISAANKEVEEVMETIRPYICGIPSRTNENVILQAFPSLRSLLCATR